MRFIVVGSCTVPLLHGGGAFSLVVPVAVVWLMVLSALRTAEDVLLDLEPEAVDDRAAVPLWPFALVGALSYCAASLLLKLVCSTLNTLLP